MKTKEQKLKALELKIKKMHKKYALNVEKYFNLFNRVTDYLTKRHRKKLSKLEDRVVKLRDEVEGIEWHNKD